MKARLAAFAVMLALAGCNSPRVTQPENEDTVNVVRTDTGVANSAYDNQAGNYDEGNVTPGETGNIYATEQRKPEQVLALFGDLLHQHKFKDAFRLVDGQAMKMDEKAFEARFDKYKTIDAAVGKVGPTEGAAGSLYSQIQLTLSGNTDGGTAYVLTGPVTLRRVNDVPGSTAEQRRWRIEKMELTNNPKAAEKLVNQ